MTKGMRLLIVFFILICVIVGMMQCAEKAMKKKKAHIEDGRAPLPPIHFALSGPAVRAGPAFRAGTAFRAGIAWPA
ncbi:MAG: hypothetical protein ABI036_03620 [Fibrobacteria bacterium]